jgi:hypothetical protein
VQSCTGDKGPAGHHKPLDNGCMAARELGPCIKPIDMERKEFV